MSAPIIESLSAVKLTVGQLAWAIADLSEEQDQRYLIRFIICT